MIPLPPFYASASCDFIEKRLAMVSHCIRLAIGSLALCIASSAGAQENLERGKTLYASQCERCHKSPQSVIKTFRGSGLENFLSVHYADIPELAAAIAAYLKGLEQPKRPIPRQRPKRTSEANPCPFRKSHPT